MHSLEGAWIATQMLNNWFKIIKTIQSKASYMYTPVIPAWRGLKQDQAFTDSLDYIVRVCLKEIVCFQELHI